VLGKVYGGEALLKELGSTAPSRRRR
jgi:hypothetical protein